MTELARQARLSGFTSQQLMHDVIKLKVKKTNFVKLYQSCDNGQLTKYDEVFGYIQSLSQNCQTEDMEECHYFSFFKKIEEKCGCVSWGLEKLREVGSEVISFQENITPGFFLHF